MRGSPPARPLGGVTLPDEQIDGWLRWSAALCAIVSLGALVTHVFGLLPMVFFLTFFGVPSILLLLVMAAYARWINAPVFLTALAVGLAGGFVGTLAYDGVRLLFRTLHLFNYDGFVAIYIFGGWITGRETTTVEAAIAGWTYHFWNGLSFGVFYVLTFGRRHWLYGAAYGVVMELCMLGLFPLFVQVTDRFDFILLSLIGHLVYGAVLGLIAQHWARSF